MTPNQNTGTHSRTTTAILQVVLAALIGVAAWTCMSLIDSRERLAKVEAVQEVYGDFTTRLEDRIVKKMDYLAEAISDHTANHSTRLNIEDYGIISQPDSR